MKRRPIAFQQEQNHLIRKLAATLTILSPHMPHLAAIWENVQQRLCLADHEATKQRLNVLESEVRKISLAQQPTAVSLYGDVVPELQKQ